MLFTNPKTYAIKGNFVFYTNNEFYCNKATVVISNGVIVDIFSYNSPSGLDLVIELEENDVVFPGLIDLHSHHTYNMLPIWERPDGVAHPWDNRYEWRNCDDYDIAIKQNMIKLSDNWNKTINDKGVTVGDLLLYFAEIQAVAGGTTVLQEPTHINVPDKSDLLGADAQENDEIIFKYNYFAKVNDLYIEDDAEGAYINTPHLILRGTQSPKELGVPDSEGAIINSVVDLFAPKYVERNIQPHKNTSSWEICDKDWQNLVNYLHKLSSGDKTYRGYIVHLGEGRAGFLCPDGWGRDGYSGKELPELITRLNKLISTKEITQDSIRDLHLNLIHACGADLSNSSVTRFLSYYGIGIIWSPVSNLLLYEDTPNFYEKMVNDSITLGIGSDWSPSGSKHVWDECKFAYKYLKHRLPANQRIGHNVIKMATVNAAKMIGSEKIGNIHKGGFADLFVLKSKNNIAANINIALDTFFNSDDDRVQMVIIGGNLVYGEKKYFDITSQQGALIPTSKEILRNKMVFLPDTWNVKLDNDLNRLDFTLKGISRSKFRSCEDTDYRRIINKLESKFC